MALFGLRKGLHCGFQVHRSCLKDFWCQKVSSLCRLQHLGCPAELAGCKEELTTEDLIDVVTEEELQEAERGVREVEEQNQRLIEDSSCDFESL